MRWLISFQLAVAGQELMKSLKMKRREIIKQMVKSVIKLMVFIMLFPLKSWTSYAAILKI